MPPPAPPAAAGPLRLFVIRHGKAERNSATGEDEDRKLKPRGERQAAYIAEQLSRERPRTALLIHSPVLRAVQTAKLIAGPLEIKSIGDEALAVDQPARGIVAVIERERGRGRLAIVGHNPTLERLATMLAPGQFKSEDVGLRTGEALVFEVPEGKALSEASLVGRWRLPEDDED